MGDPAGEGGGGVRGVDLARITEELAELWRHSQSTEIQEAIERLWSAAYSVDRSWSGSCIGYHANVYYQDFEPPPPGQSFSVEWGITGGTFGSPGKWAEQDPDHVQQMIYERAGVSDDAVLTDFNDRASTCFEEQRLIVLSGLAALDKQLGLDDFLSRVKAKAEAVTLSTLSSLVSSLMPQGQLTTRDERAAIEGKRIPRHYHVLGRVMQAKEAIDAIAQLRTIVQTTRQHVIRIEPPESQTPRPHVIRTERPGSQDTNNGTVVFIGHGRTQTWRVLKNFLEDQLGLEVEEFSRVSVAGRTTTDRLKEMLGRAAFAFLVLTGEDETVSGGLQPRMNVVHELGLFQGRLGFERAIILLEDECEEFSNIHGLGQIRFRKDDITSVFEDIRGVLEREGIGG